MENLNYYKIENGDASQVVIICASSEEKALQLLKEANCETFESYEDYNEENPDEFKTKEEFEEWNYEAFFNIFPKNASSICKLELKEGKMFHFSAEFFE